MHRKRWDVGIGTVARKNALVETKGIEKTKLLQQVFGMKRILSRQRFGRGGLRLESSSLDRMRRYCLLTNGGDQVKTLGLTRGAHRGTDWVIGGWSC